VIYFLVTSEHRYTMELYVGHAAGPLASRIEIIPYETLRVRTTFPVGTYIFADLERLQPHQAQRAARLCRTLRKAGFRVLNDPARTLTRYALARRLFESGDSAFDVIRLSENGRPHRFPVFLRPEREHRVMSGLLRSEEKLAEGMRRALAQGYRHDELLMVEFCDTSDADGVFRTYSALVVADRVIPRNVFAGRTWKLKADTLMDERSLAEEREYVTANPHQDWIRTVFRQAHAEYGKIDYAMCNGKGQVWEVQTNPVILWPSSEVLAAKLAVQRAFIADLGRALAAIDYSPPPGRGFCVSFSD
jgi:hypothetical protein